MMTASALKKKAETILNGVDAALNKIEALPATSEEKRRLIKEWFRSRLAELTAEGSHQDAE